MSYAIQESWRPLRKEDEQNLTGIKEGFIEHLADGRSLLYLREGQRPKFTGCLCSYYARHQPGEDKPNLIAQMVDGKIAMHPSGEVQLAHLSTADLPGYLSVVSNSLDGLLPHFERVPAQNEFYRTEVQTLAKIKSIAEDLKTGRLSDADRDFIFWILY